MPRLRGQYNRVKSELFEPYKRGIFAVIADLEKGRKRRVLYYVDTGRFTAVFLRGGVEVPQGIRRAYRANQAPTRGRGGPSQEHGGRTRGRGAKISNGHETQDHAPNPGTARAKLGVFGVFVGACALCTEAHGRARDVHPVRFIVKNPRSFSVELFHLREMGVFRTETPLISTIRENTRDCTADRINAPKNAVIFVN